ISPVREGFVVYVATSGGFRIKKVMGSKSTYYRACFGGLGGRLLKPGDRLRVSEVDLNSIWDLIAGKTAPDEVRGRIPRQNSVVGVRVTKGVNYDLLKEEFENFLNNVYTVSPESDRMGYRLEGPVLDRAKSLGRLISMATDRGYVQVPPSGKPIILMSDAQTTGGYAVLAHVVPSDVDVVAQCAPGSRLRFIEVGTEVAEKIFLEYLLMLSHVKLIEEEVWGELI
ncbi:MAG: biotin-dependent carboxyltransferase family protein, partial [Desulfurococcales archaeon]|nr:biotin-dependent carboxyltransferase family protein [Desulfurococcales archaeon]